MANRVIIFKKSVPGINARALGRMAERASRLVNLRGTVNLLITSSRELRSLNARFRGKDKPTDVLSFSPIAGLVPGLAGDIAISAEIATRNARRLGHGPAEEIKILALHGILHLAGYDHESDEGNMARKEIKLRKQLGLPLGLIERDAGQKPAPRRKMGKPSAARPLRQQ